ncbi:hypothetical protein HK405_000231 [Cladochytrium tenue]|nr:hypothetical protein HK405_000231 [Cladochytrium tenue]
MVPGYTPFHATTVAAVYERVQKKSETAADPTTAGRMHWSSRMGKTTREFLGRLLDSDSSWRLGTPLPRPGKPAGAAAVKADAWFAGVNWTAVAEGRAAPPFTPGQVPPHPLVLAANGSPGERSWVIGDGINASSPQASVIGPDPPPETKRWKQFRYHAEK